MVGGGIPTPRSDRAEAIAELALDMQASITRFNEERGEIDVKGKGKMPAYLLIGRKIKDFPG